MSQILIKNTNILSMDAKQDSLYEGDILIEDSSIKKVGEVGLDDLNNPEIIDGKDTVCMPGLVNTHTHAAMSLLRSYADDMELMPWLEKKIWPREAKLTGEYVYWGTKLACLEMIKSGTTTFCDMYFFMEDIAKATVDSGIRAVLGRGISDISGNGENSLKESSDFIKKWRDHERINVMLAPHAPYTCSDAYLKKVVSLAKELDVGIHIHLAETKNECETVLKETGKSPIGHMEELGLFDLPTLAAHCVYVDENDMDIMKKHDVSIAHNPESNMKLASGMAPVSRMLEKGLKVGIGTDGASSNNNLNMMEEMHVAALLSKVSTLDPTVLPAKKVLELGTIEGAKALRLEDEIGSIEVGKKADLILIDLKQAHLYPRHDIIANLVYSAQGSDVKTSIINGQIVMKDRKMTLLDEEKIMLEADRCAKEMLLD